MAEPLDICASVVEPAVVAEIRAMTPTCFQNLLSRACDKLAEGSGAEDGVGMSIDPLIGSIMRAPDPEGVRFSMLGRLKAGRFRQFEVRVIGTYGRDGVGFKSIEKAYENGRAPADVFAIAG